MNLQDGEVFELSDLRRDAPLQVVGSQVTGQADNQNLIQFSKQNPRNWYNKADRVMLAEADIHCP
jgi:hypothetical protein